MPRESTMLQVLVSIQGLILNAKPYFNEPGFAGSEGTVAGEQSSLQYNENTYISNLRTMLYSIRKPPKVHYMFSFCINLALIFLIFFAFRKCN